MTKPLSGLPFDDIRNLLRELPKADEMAASSVRARQAQLATPEGSLGRLGEISEFLAAWQGRARPSVDRPLVAIFAANHGVAARGLTLWSTDVTRQMVETFAAGGAAVNQLALEFGAGLKVFDLALDLPTPDIGEGEAMSEAACAATMAFGMEAIAGGGDLLCLGDMGIGNKTIAAALSAVLFDGDPRDWIDPQPATTFAARRTLVEDALAHHGAAALADPLEALRRVGGREFAAIVGAILAARYQRIPVLLDGFAACAAAAVLYRIDPGALDHCLAAHSSGDATHDRLLHAIGKRPLLDLGITLAGATGAALAVGIVKAAAAVHNGMASYDEAGISDLPRMLDLGSVVEI